MTNIKHNDKILT